MKKINKKHLIGVLLVILAIDLVVEGVKALSAQKKQKAAA